MEKERVLLKSGSTTAQQDASLTLCENTHENHIKRKVGTKMKPLASIKQGKIPLKEGQE